MWKIICVFKYDRFLINCKEFCVSMSCVKEVVISVSPSISLVAAVTSPCCGAYPVSAAVLARVPHLSVVPVHMTSDTPASALPLLWCLYEGLSSSLRNTRHDLVLAGDYQVLTHLLTEVALTGYGASISFLGASFLMWYFTQLCVVGSCPCGKGA